MFNLKSGVRLYTELENWSVLHSPQATREDPKSMTRIGLEEKLFDWVQECQRGCDVIYIYIYNDKHRIQKLPCNAHSISDMLMIDCHWVISECKEDIGACMRTSRTDLCTTKKGSI